MTATSAATLAPPVLDCRAVLVAGMAARGITVTVSLAPPIVRSPWEPFVCPHGCHYWMAPTAAQLLAWTEPPR